MYDVHVGASAGIGEACAWRFADAGCKLVLVARRQDRLESLKKVLMDTYNVHVHTVVLDVRDIDALMDMVGSLPDGFKHIDILVNNAGLALGLDTTDQVNIQDAMQMIDTNVKAVIALTSAVSKTMR